MKRFFVPFLIFTTLFLCVPSAPAHAEGLAQRLRGRIFLQVESYGRAWYVNPMDGSRYYLKDGATAFSLMREKGLGISRADLEKIPAEAGQTADKKLVARLSGRILLQTQEKGEAWYVNPVDGFRYYLKDGEAAYLLMKAFGTGITNANLRAIPMNTTQIVHDTTFDDVAYVQVRNGTVLRGKYADNILPPASMSKLVTALVLLDQANLDWNKSVLITQAHLDYPKDMVGGDTTSEIGIAAGDIVTMNDLWVAMLVASSNQSTIALVDGAGFSRSDFVRLMNAKVHSLGLSHTVFYDPAGLDAHNVTTPREMAIIADAAFKSSKISQAGEHSEYMITTLQNPSRVLKVVDRNYSLRAYGVDASKTGFLVEAQRCVALKKGDDIVVIMHARSMAERNGILDSLLK